MEKSSIKIPDVSIIIVSYNTEDLTRQCLKSIEVHAPPVKHEVIVVDNASTDNSVKMIKQEFPWVQLVRLEKNRGFAGGNNPGMERASGRYILLLNSDAFLAENVLRKTVAYMDENKGTGILGCKLTNPDGSLQPSARMLPGILNKCLTMTGLAYHFPKSKFFGRSDFTWWDHSEPRKVGWVVGAYFLIRYETMKEVGFLDERYFLYCEEIDYCRSVMEAGWDVVFYPHAEVVHLGGQSAIRTTARISEKGKQLLSIRISSEYKYYRKWHGIFHVIMAAGAEVCWSFIVYFRNLIRLSEHGSSRRNEAIVKIRLIFRTLLTERWGKG